MNSLRESTLPEVYDTYEAISPAKYAGKLDGKVASSQNQNFFGLI
jgi:hypothetical protein